MGSHGLVEVSFGDRLISFSIGAPSEATDLHADTNPERTQAIVVWRHTPTGRTLASRFDIVTRRLLEQHPLSIGEQRIDGVRWTGSHLLLWRALDAVSPLEAVAIPIRDLGAEPVVLGMFRGTTAHRLEGSFYLLEDQAKNGLMLFDDATLRQEPLDIPNSEPIPGVTSTTVGPYWVIYRNVILAVVSRATHQIVRYVPVWTGRGGGAP